MRKPDSEACQEIKKVIDQTIQNALNNLEKIVTTSATKFKLVFDWHWSQSTKLEKERSK